MDTGERIPQLCWDGRGLVPAIIQEASTGQVLMLAYMNQASLEKTVETGQTWFWSRSRGELWHKGATSGNIQRVVEIRYDCDADALLLRVQAAGPACHTSQRSCFYRHLPGGLKPDEGSLPRGVLTQLEAIIQDRKGTPRPGSYTRQLLEAGLSQILKKVGEEAVEVIVAAQGEGNERLVSELADLVYHALVLLAARDLSWADVETELARRFAPETPRSDPRPAGRSNP
jgi:phosphoribosyl-ATP pyrophosphohydrolase/phosphoribosyl-AMP cyclohydrolase